MPSRDRLSYSIKEKKTYIAGTGAIVNLFMQYSRTLFQLFNHASAIIKKTKVIKNYRTK